MKQCPRCHSSMVIEYGDVYDGYADLWRCISCGREIYLDRARQAEDESITQAVLVAERRKKASARTAFTLPGDLEAR